MLEGLSDRLAAQRKGRAELLKEMKSGFKETKRAGDHPAGDASWEFRTLQRVYLLHSSTPFFLQPCFRHLIKRVLGRSRRSLMVREVTALEAREPPVGTPSKKSFLLLMPVS